MMGFQRNRSHEAAVNHQRSPDGHLYHEGHRRCNGDLKRGFNGKENSKFGGQVPCNKGWEEAFRCNSQNKHSIKIFVLHVNPYQRASTTEEAL